MPKFIDRVTAEKLVTGGAQVVEVLEREQYERVHLPGAVHLPLWELEERAVDELDPERPTVVYCADLMCDMSPRAAYRLEALGFTDVHDYPGGKEDWVENGLPIEGELGDLVRAGDVARDVPTCELDTPASEAAARMRDAGADRCVVVIGDRIVLGVLDGEALADAGDWPAGEVMRAGPTTFRPGLPAHDLGHHLEERDVEQVLLSTSDGRLVGAFHRDDGLDHAAG